MSRRCTRADVPWAGVAFAALVVATVAAASACIIPDRGIRLESGDDNPGAVRIVEAIPMLPEFTEPCDEPDLTEAERRACPQVPTTSVTRGFIEGGPFCICPGRDGNTLPEFSVYAEDPDRGRNAPTDTLYAVALRDMDPATRSPQNFVAYPEHLAPGGRGEYLSRSDANVQDSIGREDNGLWRFRVGKDQGAGIDLCNDDGGESVGVGLHNLQIMITDRPFFQPIRLDENGEPERDASGSTLLGPTQYGMPDLGIGATWTVASYVFSCEDPVAQANCNCVEDPAP